MKTLALAAAAALLAASQALPARLSFADSASAPFWTDRPTLRLDISYLGDQPVAGAPVVVKVYADDSLNTPCASMSASTGASLRNAQQSLFFHPGQNDAIGQGLRYIAAFADLDADGNFSPGEPFAFDSVNFDGLFANAKIELSDTSPVVSRISLASIGPLSDRTVLYGSEHGDVVAELPGELSGGRYERVRVVRSQVNGYGIATYNMPNRVCLDKWISIDQRPFLHEGDVLLAPSSDGLDIDWDCFQSEILSNASIVSRSIDPTEVVYRIVLGNGTIDTTETNNLYSVATVRRFDASNARTLPSELAVDWSLGFPLFSWSMKISSGDVVAHNNSYPAFKLQILNGSSTVFDSGTLRAPPRDPSFRYSFAVTNSLPASSNLSWRVSMLNSKFQSPAWSSSSLSLP